MNKAGIAALSLVLSLAIVGCAERNPGFRSALASVEKDRKADVAAKIELSQSEFPLRTWKADGSNVQDVQGRVLLGDRPVENAVVSAGKGRKTIRTEPDGTFRLSVDRSLLTDTPVRVVSTDEAKIEGRPVGSETSRKIMAASASIRVYFPIEIENVEADPAKAGQVKVHARMLSRPGETVSFFKLDKYRVGGRVTDADGHPVRGAVVWLDRDRGEGFAKSTPTDENGDYELYYWPENEETNLSVTIGKTRYTLPENRVYVIPEDTSVDIRIRLPRSGTVIRDQPPDLVSKTSQGAMYTGVIAGLQVPPGTAYTVTVPDDQGRFVVTVAKQAWEKQPGFFETVLTRFFDRKEPLKAGDPLPSAILKAGPRDPAGIMPGAMTGQQ
ncbi:carboxypeptidase-like regulatory domain-containing protein [Cohnella caldifontis]|uniref:carboxypeptidase-like regulatory domain-containing protein n=1 Tax=Cohnella caldifontis TaxID=3027471 RepID=UPI0023EADFBB|nr:carboxypeptidase-like regulatory domain-containing protein [Cohnella sp. YIM B05605]